MSGGEGGGGGVEIGDKMTKEGTWKKLEENWEKKGTNMECRTKAFVRRQGVSAVKENILFASAFCLSSKRVESQN